MDPTVNATTPAPAPQDSSDAVCQSTLDAVTSPGWRCIRDERWQEKLDQLTQARSNGTKPGPELAAWLKAQRRAHATGTLREDRATALDRALYGWLPDPEADWRTKAEDVADHLDLTLKLPALADEPVLYRWLAHQRRLARAGTLDRKGAKWLDKYISGWRPVPAIDRWAANCAALEAFVARTGRYPSGTVEAERRLARWLWTQRAALRKGRLGASRREELDGRLRGWDGARRTGGHEQAQEQEQEQGEERT